MRHTLGRWLLAALVGGIAACAIPGCGGGGSGGGGQSAVGQRLGGFWTGSLTVDGVPGQQEFVGISTDDGRFRFISTDTGSQFVGAVRAVGESVVGTGKGYAPTGFTWRDGSTVTNVSMSGTIRERAMFTGSWSSGTGESGRFSFVYDPDYEKNSSLSLIAGVWTVYDDYSNPFATFTIEPDGRFTGQNAVGCTSMGQISIVDTRFNVYDIRSTISSCAIAGDYTGLGALGKVANPNDAFLFSVSNDQHALLLGLQK